MAYQRGVRPDYMVGTITLVSGETTFTTTGASLQTATVQGGDTIMTSDGRALIIRTITGQNEGELFYPCPASAAGQDLPIHIRFQPSGSGQQGAIRDLIARWGQNGNVDAFAALDGVLGGVPVFSEFGMDVVSIDDLKTEDPHHNLAQLAGIAKVNNQFITMGLDGSITLKPISELVDAIDNNRLAITALQGEKFNKPTGTLGQFLRGNGTLQSVVGTVTAADGGAIVQRGSNANGDFVRYADGTQICWGVVRDYPTSGATIITIIWPAVFISVPRQFSTPQTGIPSSYHPICSTATGETTGGFVVHRPNGGTTYFEWQAIGRWK